jgi:hypothetical protein
MENRQVSASQSISYRNYRRARDRALVRLSHQYPELYKEYLEEETEFDEEQGVKWFSIDDSTYVTVGVRTRTSPSGRGTTKGSSRGRKTRNNGGEA